MAGFATEFVRVFSVPQQKVLHALLTMVEQVGAM